MKKFKPDVPSIYSVKDFLSKEKILPIYFLFGEDYYAIQSAYKLIEKAADQFVESDFDKDIYSAEKDINLSQVLDAASAFPFGSSKKIVILKNFDKLNDKKELTAYAANPADFTILLLVSYSGVKDLSKEPYPTLLKNGYMFEAKELKGKQLTKWLVNRASQFGLNISEDNAEMMTDIVGYDRNLLEIQLQKIQNYLGESKEITSEAVEALSSSTKEFTIFNLLDAVGKGEKALSLKIGYGLLNGGFDMIRIVNMLTKYVTVLAQYLELRKKGGLSSFQAAREADVSHYFYQNCAQAKFMHSEKRLLNSTRALYQADLSLKTTAVDEKTLLAVVIDQIMEM